MRGTQGRWRPRGRHCGIIPAYAGNTRPPACYGTCARDHPRVCGEHCLIHTVGQTHVGIIPAYAGNTRLQRCQRGRCRDHPRVCGEHCDALPPAFPSAGSSPRMRGTPMRSVPRFFRSGIIPAYAGNTCSAERSISAIWDHPRVCGEHMMCMT